jgi:hypothetical protein
MMAFELFTTSICDAYSGGSGIQDDPYQIADSNDWQQLIDTSDDWDKFFILVADINLTGITVVPIAPDEDATAINGFQGPGFTGVFDGNDHVIRNAIINLPSADYVGLFGGIGAGGQIRNLGVEDANITGSQIVGGLAGNNYGVIDNCYCAGLVSGDYYIGGLVGSNGWVSGTGNRIGGLVGDNGMYSINYNYGKIDSCYSTSTVTATYGDVGGLVGFNSDSVTNCYASGDVSGESYNIGGLIGDNQGVAVMSYATGTVIGGNSVGGLIGQHHYGAGVVSCYATGAVSGGTYVGGLVGKNDGGVLLCHATGSVSAYSHVGGLVGLNWNSIALCYATGDVNGSYVSVGGLVGENQTWSSVTSSYAIGAVRGYSAVGGLVGYNVSSAGVVSCYAEGVVSGEVRIGGLVGLNEGGVVSSYSTGPVAVPYYYDPNYAGGLVGINDNVVIASFWDTETSGRGNGVGSNSSSFDGVYGGTTSEMKTQSTFTDAGWDFVGEIINGTDDIRRMCTDGINYPKLYWQYSLNGDFDCPDGVGWEDLFYLSQRWLQTTNPFEGADITGDSIVNFQDYAILASHWR